MVEVIKKGAYLVDGQIVYADQAQNVATPDEAREKTIAYSILRAHNKGKDPKKMQIKFDALISHDITFVGIIQTAKASGLKEFPAIDYATHGEEALAPKTVAQVFSDGVHLIQPVYNALGMDIAQNLFAYLRTYRQVESVSFQRPDGNKIYDDVSLSGPSDYLRLVPIVDPITASDLTFTLTDNLAMEYPGKVTVIGEGEGKITVSQGDRVLAEIVVWVED